MYVRHRHEIELNASNNPNISNIDGFVKTLQILDASYNCGISDNNLINANNIIELNSTNNFKITNPKFNNKQLILFNYYYSSILAPAIYDLTFA